MGQKATALWTIRAGEEGTIAAFGRRRHQNIVKTMAHLSVDLMELYALKEVSDVEMRRVETRW